MKIKIIKKENQYKEMISKESKQNKDNKLEDKDIKSNEGINLDKENKLNEEIKLEDKNIKLEDKNMR